MTQKKIRQQQDMQRNKKEDTIHSPTGNLSTSAYSEMGSSSSIFSLPQLPPRGYPSSSPSSPSYPSDKVEKKFEREREDAQGHFRRGWLDASTTSKPDLRVSSSSSAFILEPGQSGISTAGVFSGGGKSAKNTSLASPSVSLSLQKKQKNNHAFVCHPDEMSKGSVSNAPASGATEMHSTTETSQHGVEAFATLTENRSSSDLTGRKESGEGKRTHASDPTQKDRGKTRPVPYSISLHTPPAELLHIIQTLQQELNERTLSVNAIQRNFERLSNMYQTSQKEMETLRDEHEQYQRATHDDDAAQKVVRAMQVEMEKQLEEHQMLRATCEKERAEANAREVQLQTTLSHVQQQLKEREEEVQQQQRRWSEMEIKQGKWVAAQQQRMEMSIHAVLEKEAVKRQEEAERWHAMAVRQRVAERARHRAALEQLIQEAMLVWQQGQQSPFWPLSTATARDGSAVDDDRFAQWIEMVRGKDWQRSCTPTSRSSASAFSFFSFPPSWGRDEHTDHDPEGDNENPHHSVSATPAMVSLHSFDAPHDVDDDDEAHEKKDSLEYWVVPLKDLLKRIREGFMKAEQERQQEHALHDHLSHSIGGASRALTAAEEALENRKSLESALARQQEKWKHWSFSFCVETEEKCRRWLETHCFHSYQQWCHQWAASSRALWCTFSNVKNQKDQQIGKLSEALKALQKASEEDRERFQERITLDTKRLQEKLALAETATHEYAQKMFTVELERDQAKTALHILTTDAANEKKKWSTNEAENRQKQKDENAAVAEMHSKALQKLREELEAEHTTSKQQYTEEIQSLRGALENLHKRTREERKDQERGSMKLLQRVEQKKRVLFQALLKTYVIDEEHASRCRITDDECFHRQVHGHYYTYQWMTQRTRVCQKQIWELTTTETAARTALRIEEIASCTSMVFYISTATARGENERHGKREREEVLYQLEALRQRLQQRERELLILHEECGQLTKTEQQHHLNLKEKDLLQSKYDILEEEMEALKVRQGKEMESVERIQKAAVSSIQCLITAEEASESTYSCPLCLELFQHPLVCVPCGHTFCEGCIRDHPRNVRLRKLSAHFDSPSSKEESRGSTTSLGLYCPECRSHTVSSLLESKTLAALSSKFEYRKKILRDIVHAFRQSSFGQAPSSS